MSYVLLQIKLIMGWQEKKKLIGSLQNTNCTQLRSEVHSKTLYTNPTVGLYFVPLIKEKTLLLYTEFTVLIKSDIIHSNFKTLNRYRFASPKCGYNTFLVSIEQEKRNLLF